MSLPVDAKIRDLSLEFKMLVNSTNCFGEKLKETHSVNIRSKLGTHLSRLQKNEELSGLTTNWPLVYSSKLFPLRFRRHRNFQDIHRIYPIRASLEQWCLSAVCKPGILWKIQLSDNSTRGNSKHGIKFHRAFTLPSKMALLEEARLLLLPEHDPRFGFKTDDQLEAALSPLGRIF